MLVVILVGPVLPGLALGQAPQDPPPLTDEFSAADQYVESVPTAGGPKAPGVDREKKKRQAPVKLSPSVESSLQRQPEETATKLERIATSPDYGAPTRKLRKPSASSPRVPAATVSAVSDGDGTTLAWLVVGLIATTALAVGTAAHRRYQDKKNTG